MSTEKKTEDIIKDKLDSRGFAFDDKAWAGMESLLDGQEKSKKRAFFWYFSASMFIVLVAGAALVKFNGDKSEEVESLKSEVASPKSEVAEITELKKNQEVGVGSDKSGVESKELGVTEAVQVTQENKEAAISVTNSKIKNQKSKTGKGSDVGSPKSDVSTQGINNNQKSPSGNNGLAAGSSQPGVGSGELAANTDVAATAQIPQVPNVPQESKPEEITTSEELTGQTPEIIPEPEAVQATIDTATARSSTPEPEKQNPLAAPGKETKNAWGVMAGAGAWLPFQSTPGATENKGMIGFTGGIYYQRVLSKRFDIGLGVNYSGRGALNYDQTFISSEFGFGVQSDKTIVSPRTLHYLNIPLYLRLNVSPRSHFIFGAAWYKLLTTTYKTDHIVESSFGVLEHTTKKQSGDHPGFRKNDIAAFIGYELTLFDRMNAGLQFSYGFYDITENSYSGINSADKNISLQLQLKYDLITH